MNDAQQCQARVPEPPGYWREHQCSRRSATSRVGVPLCQQHARIADMRPWKLADWKWLAGR